MFGIRGIFSGLGCGSAGWPDGNTEPGRKHIAVHARKLDLQQGLQFVRRNHRHLSRSLEQTDRSTMEDNIYRSQEMGTWVLINAIWYNL